MKFLPGEEFLSGWEPLIYWIVIPLMIPAWLDA